MKNIVIAVISLLVIIGATYFFLTQSNSNQTTYNKETTTEPVLNSTTTSPTPEPEAEQTNESEEAASRGSESVIGTTVSGNEIRAYHFGSGSNEVTLIGGVHGGYSWNTALLAYEVIDWLEANPDTIPEDITLTIIPVLNPDGLESVTKIDGRFTAANTTGVSETEKIKGRFNANDVDLNRNFACDWQATGTWQNRSVSGGTAAFSEPESQAIRTYVATYKPKAIVTWFSSAGGVYASGCAGKTPSGTADLTARYASAANYTAYAEYNYYELTGDMVNWFASENIPAISVLLTNHTDTEFEKNRAGIEALLNYLSE